MLSSFFFFSLIYRTPEYPTLLLPFQSYIPFYYYIVFSSIAFNSIPFKIQFPQLPVLLHVPLTKILRSIIPIVRRMCLNFQQ